MHYFQLQLLYYKLLDVYYITLYYDAVDWMYANLNTTFAHL